MPSLNNSSRRCAHTLLIFSPPWKGMPIGDARWKRLIQQQVTGCNRGKKRRYSRYNIELFHKTVKQHLGFEDVATSGFDSVMSHVHWVYCAYILLSMSPPGVSADVTSLGDKQRQLQQLLANQEKRRVFQKLTKIGGGQCYKDALRQALADA